MEKLTIEQLEVEIEKKREIERGKRVQAKVTKKKESKGKRRMKTSKKAMWALYLLCFTLISFVMIMLWKGMDSTTLGVMAGASLIIIPVTQKIYNDSADKEKLKHMEMDYNPNYDKEHNIF